MVDQWISNDQNSRIKGRHTKSFTKHIPECVTVLQALSNSLEMGHFAKFYELFCKMSKIIGLIIINEYADKQIRTSLANDEDHTAITKKSTNEEIDQKVMQSYTNLAKKIYSQGINPFFATILP